MVVGNAIKIETTQWHDGEVPYRFDVGERVRVHAPDHGIDAEAVIERRTHSTAYDSDGPKHANTYYVQFEEPLEDGEVCIRNAPEEILKPVEEQA